MAPIQWRTRRLSRLAVAVLAVALCIGGYFYVSYRIDLYAVENFNFQRDLNTQESWPEVEPNLKEQGHVYMKVHLMWCGSKIFRFHHYLSVLSVIRILRPHKIVFHYYYEPQPDGSWYHNWFSELKQSTPNMVMRQTASAVQCGSPEAMTMALKILSEEGGIYVGEKTVVTHFPKEALTSDVFSYTYTPAIDSDETQGIVISHTPKSLPDLLSKVQRQSSTACQTVETFVQSGLKAHQSTPCLLLREELFPRDIWGLDNQFGEISRWLFYGSRRNLQVKPDPNDDNLIPPVAHITFLKSGKAFDKDEFTFLHFLSVMSALYVAGLERVYVHGQTPPTGRWWNRLQGHNVTHVRTEHPETVFQQKIGRGAHQSDILRTYIVMRTGGVYQDRDIIWVSPIPKALRRYPAVVGADWTKNGQWPDVFNIGILMAKPGSVWLNHLMQTFNYYRDDLNIFNAAQMPYKVYEYHPDTLYKDEFMQVICFKGICHAGWDKDYVRSVYDSRPTDPFDWRRARAFHFTKPKPVPEMASPKAILEGKGIFSEIGRMILEKSGQLHLMHEPDS